MIVKDHHPLLRRKIEGVSSEPQPLSPSAARAAITSHQDPEKISAAQKHVSYSCSGDIPVGYGLPRMFIKFSSEAQCNDPWWKEQQETVHHQSCPNLAAPPTFCRVLPRGHWHGEQEPSCTRHDLDERIGPQAVRCGNIPQVMQLRNACIVLMRVA